MAQAGYAPGAYEALLQSLVALAAVHAPSAPPPKAIADRIEEIRREIAERHWEAHGRTRPLRLPLSGD